MLSASLALAAAVLEPQALPRLDKGACAVLVWSAAEPRGPLVVLSGSPPVARIRRDGRLKLLPRAGEPTGEGRQVFRGLGLRLELDVKLGRGLIAAGEVTPEGVLSFREGDGASVLIPVRVAPLCQD
ncbi:hypothetical protein [Phenylobacterium sp.]|uniref:hypothetical protein n=1 Tax=Phenylobacterium sp. TaxID=1871053 RepID=UPI002812579B|nr:hypothetical protein [Phenylobacterium sp.]